MRFYHFLTLAAIIATTSQVAAAPTSFLQGEGAQQPVATTSVEEADKGGRTFGWLTKWFGSSSDSTPEQAPIAGQSPFAYQAPQAEAIRVAARPDSSQAIASSDVSLEARSSPVADQSRQIVDASQALEAQGQIDQARALLVDHLTQNPYDVRPLRELGRLEDRQGNLAQAEVHYLQAIGADPNSAAAMNDLALCLARQGRMEESTDRFRQAIEANPQKKLYRNNIATVLVELRRDEEALSHLQVVYSPATASFNLGQLHARSGRTDDARLRYQEALAIDPQHLAAGRALAKIGAEPPAPMTKVAQAPPTVLAPESVPTTPIEPEQTPEPVLEAETTEPASAPAAPSFPRLLPPVINR